MGMAGEELGAESGSVEMEIDFRGGYGFMAEHLLYGPQIRTPLQQMSGEGMAQSMGRDGLVDTG